MRVAHVPANALSCGQAVAQTGAVQTRRRASAPTRRWGRPTWGGCLWSMSRGFRPSSRADGSPR